MNNKERVDITFEEFERSVEIIMPIAHLMGIDISELVAFYKCMNELHHAGISASVAAIRLRKAIKRILDEKDT